VVVSSRRSSMRRSTAGSPNSGTFSTAVRARAVGSTSAGRSRAALPYDLDRGINRCAAHGHARVGALVAAEAKSRGDRTPIQQCWQEVRGRLPIDSM